MPHKSNSYLCGLNLPLYISVICFCINSLTVSGYLQYTIAMMGYGPEDKFPVLELTYNYGVTEYDKGNAYAQVKEN